MGNTYTTDYRFYDTRLGRWLSVDPLFFEYASLTPFSFVGNNPIGFYDPNGDSIVAVNKTSKDFESDKNILIASLQKKTGLKLNFDESNTLRYERDSNGDPIVNEGNYSESARNDLIKSIDDKEFKYEVRLFNGNDKINMGNSTHRNKSVYPEHKFGFMQLDMSDFNLTDPPEFDMGFVFFHELQHGYFGLSDTKVSFKIAQGNDKPELYPGTGLYRLGEKGETVERVNVYRKEMGLPQRAQYHSVEGKGVLFYRVITKTNAKNGKTKYVYNYYYINLKYDG